jgi:hypothetical protein
MVDMVIGMALPLASSQIYPSWARMVQPWPTARNVPRPDPTATRGGEEIDCQVQAFLL